MKTGCLRYLSFFRDSDTVNPFPLLPCQLPKWPSIVFNAIITSIYKHLFCQAFLDASPYWTRPKYPFALIASVDTLLSHYLSPPTVALPTQFLILKLRALSTCCSKSHKFCSVSDVLWHISRNFPCTLIEYHGHLYCIENI